jgi:hypothetical protein
MYFKYLIISDGKYTGNLRTQTKNFKLVTLVGKYDMIFLSLKCFKDVSSKVKYLRAVESRGSAARGQQQCFQKKI